MRKAAIIAQDALEETLKLVKPGVTERELGSELVAQMLRLGSDPKLPFDPIVGSGPNSANPHAEVSDREIQYGDFLLLCPLQRLLLRHHPHLRRRRTLR